MLDDELPLPADNDAMRVGGGDKGISPPLPIGDAFEIDDALAAILSMKSAMDLGVLLAVAATDAPPVATAAPRAAPVAAAWATSPVPMEVEPDANEAAMESDLNVR